MTIAIGYSSETFEFKSKYPKLWVSAFPVANANLVDPSATATVFLDGEYALLSAGGVNRPTIGGQDDPQIIECHHVTGNPGRADLQFGMIPFVLDDNYLFVTRLHDGNVAAGTAPNAGELCTLQTADVVIEGVTYVGRCILIALDTLAPGYYVCRVVEPVDTKGWIRCYAMRGHYRQA